MLRGSSPSPTPFLDSLFNDGFELTSCYSTGYPTQFALPGLMTSTLPLDYGGYEYGIRTRPTALSESFQNAGYSTAAFVTAFWLGRLYGYDRGIKTFCPLFNLEFWTKNLKGVYLKYAKQLIESGDKSTEEAVELLCPLVGEFLDHLVDYCNERRAEVNQERLHPHYLSSRLHAWDFERAADVAKKAQESFDKDPTTFVATLLQETKQEESSRLFQREGSWFDELLATQLSERAESKSKWLRSLPLVASWASPYGPSPSRMFEQPMEDIENWVDMVRRGKISSARYVTENLATWIEGSEDPYFAWTHLHDIHSESMFTLDFDEEQWFGTELAGHRKFLRGWGGKSLPESTNISRTLSSRYVDTVLEQFVNRVVEGSNNPPLIVITADHGKQRPTRSGDHVNQFYDSLLHVPVAFVHPDLESGSFDGLCSSLDIAPTLLNLLGIDIPESFDGVPVSQYPDGGRSYVIAEDLGRGPCDPSKPANICLRTDDRKVVCSAPVNGNERFSVEYASDLKEDPQELSPLDTSDLPEGFDTLIENVRKRAHQIRQSLAGDAGIPPNSGPSSGNLWKNTQ